MSINVKVQLVGSREPFAFFEADCLPQERDGIEIDGELFVVRVRLFRVVRGSLPPASLEVVLAVDPVNI